MTEYFETKCYSFDFYDDGYEAKLKVEKYSPFLYVLGIFFYVLSLLGSIALIYLGFFISKSSTGHGVIGIIWFAINSILVVIFAIEHQIFKKRLERYRFKIDGNGITHVDLKKTFYIPWSEVEAFGFVTFCKIGGGGKHPPNVQTCLYFSKNVENEKKLRFKFHLWNHKSEHRSNKDIIAFAFGEDNIRSIIEEKFTPYFYKYCDKEKEANFESIYTGL